MTATEGFFDFLRGDNHPITQSISPEKLFISENEKFFLYTHPSESFECTLQSLFIANYFNAEEKDVLKGLKSVKCASCSPNGNLPIMVAESNGLVLEYADILNRLVKIEDISLFVSIDALLGRYVRSFDVKCLRKEQPDILSVLELIEYLNHIDDLSTLEASIQILLFSVIQAVKQRLNHDDLVRKAIERSETLGSLFLEVLSRVSSHD